MAADPDPISLPRTSFVGRAAELSGLREALQGTRLVSLVGPGGAGKTRLALELLRTAEGRTAFTDLAGLHDPALVPATILRALGRSELAGSTPLQTAIAAVGGDDVVVVLDNCEHLLGGVASAARALLDGCPRLRIVATSRERLRLGDETVQPVAGLRIDDEAVQLLLDRVHAAVPGFDPGGPEIEALHEVCRRLDGLPLALELAAARLRSLTPQELVRNLDDPLHALGPAPRDVPPRHRTLGASIAWSIALLDEPERVLLRRLSVFSGGCSLGAITAVCAQEGPPPLDALHGLVERSLVMAAPIGDGVMRYQLLEVVREDAARRLRASGESHDLHARHVGYFRRLAEQANALRRSEAGRRRLIAEERNLQAAVAWAAEHDPEAALAIAAGLGRWWGVSDRYDGGRLMCERALAAGDPDDQPDLRAVVHWAAGCLALLRRDVPRLLEHANAGSALAERATTPEARGLPHMLWAAMLCGSVPAEGRRRGEQALAALTEGEPTDPLYALAPLSSAHLRLDELDAAETLSRHSIELAAEHGDAVNEAHGLRGLGQVLHARGDLRGALEAMNAAERRAPETGLVGLLGIAMRAPVLAALGRTDEARAQASGALGEADAVLPTASQYLLAGLAVVELAAGRLDAARARAEGALEAELAWLKGVALDTLLLAALAAGDREGARDHAEALQRLSVDTGMPGLGARAAYGFGRIALLEGRVPRARDHLHEALEHQATAGLRLALQDTVEALGAAAGAAGDTTMSGRLLGWAQADRRRAGAHRIPAEEAWLAEARAPAAPEALREGETLDLTRMLALVRRGRGPRGRPASGWASLTPAEGDVARLAAEGRTNPEIAAELLMSRSTVKLHLSRVFGKLGVTNRTELATARAQENGHLADVPPASRA